MFLVLQHEPGEGLGLLERHLRPGPVRVVKTFAGEAVPREPRDAKAVIVLGGGMAVYEQDRFSHLADEIALLRRCVEASVPVLGLCLGAQLLAAALHARVAPSGRKEIGFHPVRLLEAARSDPLFSGLPADFSPFHWHGDVFDLPAGAVALARSDLTPVQAFRFRDRYWGIQFHPEVDRDVLAAMTSTGSAELAEEDLDPAALLADATTRLSLLQPIVEPLFSRFVSQLRPT